MNEKTKELWESLHKNSRFRPKYPSEVVVRYVFRNFKRNGEEKILDLGCGAGRHVYFMAKENIKVYGVDISSSGIDYTKNVLENNGLEGDLKVGSMDNIPYCDETFDGLINYGVLYYCDIKGASKTASEIYRVMKKGGKVLIVVRTTEDYRYGDGLEIEKNTFIINENDKNKCAFNENGMKMHFFDKDEILNIFSDFSSIKIDKWDETIDNESYKDSNFIIQLVK